MSSYPFYGNRSLSDEVRISTLSELLSITANNADTGIKGINSDLYLSGLFSTESISTDTPGTITRIATGLKNKETFYKCVFEIKPTISVFFELWAKDWEKLKVNERPF